MRKLFLVVLVNISVANTFAQNLNPYQQFGYQTKNQYVRTKEDDGLWLNNKDTSSQAKKMLINFKSKQIFVINENDSIVSVSTISGDVLTRFLSVDPLTRKYPELTPYQFASNTPIQAIDLDGLEAFFVHGTASSPSRWTENGEIIPQYLRISGNTKYDATFEWGLRATKNQSNFTKYGNGFMNQSTDREIAAKALVQHIISSGLIDPKEGVVTLIGHSHGGNVAIQAADGLRKYLDSKPEYKSMKINIITVSTPAENTPFADENPREHFSSINVHLHLFNEEDVVQRTLSNEMKSKFDIKLPFLRTYKNLEPMSVDLTKNQEIDVSKYYGSHTIATSVEAHSFDVKHPDLLNQVQPIVH